MVGFYIQAEKRCQILRKSKAALIRLAATFQETATKTSVQRTRNNRYTIFTFKTLMSLSPLENLLSLLFRDMDSKVTQGLKDFLRIDPACVTKMGHKWVKWGFYLQDFCITCKEGKLLFLWGHTIIFAQSRTASVKCGALQQPILSIPASVI